MRLSELIEIIKNDIPRIVKNKRISYSRLAEILGVHSSSISRWVKNDFSNCDLSEFLKILKLIEKSGTYNNDYIKILAQTNTDCTEATGTIEQIREDDTRP